MDAQHTKHVTYKLAYHFVWCPKYRKKILVGKLATFIEREICRMCFDDSEYEYPHVAHQMNTLEAVGSVLDEDGKGGYRFDRMTFKNPIDMLGFAPSIHERPNPG